MIVVLHHLVRRDAVRGEFRVLAVIGGAAAPVRELEELRVLGHRTRRADDLAAEADRDVLAKVSETHADARERERRAVRSPAWKYRGPGSAGRPRGR